MFPPIKRKHRTDYTFTFKVPKYKVKDAEFKVAINVIGDVGSDNSWNGIYLINGNGKEQSAQPEKRFFPLSVLLFL